MDYSDQLIIHGAINGLISAFAGIPYAKSIIQKKDEAERAWKLVHSAGSMGAILILAISSILNRFVSPHIEIIFYSTLICGYGFMLGMIVAAKTGNRGLISGSAFPNRLANISYRIAALATIVVFVTIVIGVFSYQ